MEKKSQELNVFIRINIELRVDLEKQVQRCQNKQEITGLGVREDHGCTLPKRW